MLNLVTGTIDDEIVAQYISLLDARVNVKMFNLDDIKYIKIAGENADMGAFKAYFAFPEELCLEIDKQYAELKKKEKNDTEGLYI